MRNPLRLILLVSLAVVIGGCAATQSPSYYLLEPAPVAAAPDSGRRHCMTIGLCPVRIPAYIDRPQIMVRTGKNELAISEFDLWAEPLRESTARAIARNLETMTCADVTDVLPAGRSMPADYLLNVRVDRLEGRPGGEAVLEAWWSLTGAGQRQMITGRRSRFARPVEGNDYSSLVSAYSGLIADLSTEIARAVAALAEDVD